MQKGGGEENGKLLIKVSALSPYFYKIITSLINYYLKLSQEIRLSKISKNKGGTEGSKSKEAGFRWPNSYFV